jgi:hypothetical protein
MLADRRGATAAFFGVAATVVVGFAGLAIEAGYWYGVRRDAQNAADAAAHAASVRLAFGTNILQLDASPKLAQVQNTGRDTTSRNGYETVTLPGPGTYFFYSTDLDVKGTLNWTCGGASTLGGACSHRDPRQRRRRAIGGAATLSGGSRDPRPRPAGQVTRTEG